MHMTDWLPTLYGLAGGDYKDLANRGMDGVDQWARIISNGKPARGEMIYAFRDERDVMGNPRGSAIRYNFGSNIK